MTFCLAKEKTCGERLREGRKVKPLVGSSVAEHPAWCKWSENILDYTIQSTDNMAIGLMDPKNVWMVFSLPLQPPSKLRQLQADRD